MRFIIVFTTLILCFSAIGCFGGRQLRTIKVDGTAMSPAINDGDKIVIEKFVNGSDGEIRRFDIVAFELSEDQKKVLGRADKFLLYTKRIVGMPNEELEIRKGQIFINGDFLAEPFEGRVWEEDNFGPVSIPPNEYFVLGDNRANSFDSRYLKPPTVMKRDILGKVKEVIPGKN